MSDPQPVHVGEILRGIRAADHNAFYETWRKVNQLPPKKTQAETGKFANRLVVSIFNQSGAAIDADYPVLKLASPCFTPEDRENVPYEPIAFNGDTPDAGTTSGNFAIIQGAIEADRKGHGVIAGPSWVKVNWTDEAHTHAAVEDGENTRLKSASSGIKIIWHEEIPDAEYLPIELWALVMLGGGSGDGKRTSVLKATDITPARTGDVPGDGADFDLISGDNPIGPIKNYSTVEIGAGAFMLIVEVDGADVIYNAFC